MAVNCPTKPWHACPECGAKTVLYLWPGKWAGVWACENPKCMASDSCGHKDTRTELIDDWPTGPEDNPTTSQVEICNDCGVVIEN